MGSIVEVVEGEGGEDDEEKGRVKDGRVGCWDPLLWGGIIL